MIDAFLYRRFFIVAAAIAAMGAVTANLIQETRQAPVGALRLEQPGMRDCGPARICVALPKAAYRA